MLKKIINNKGIKISLSILLILVIILICKSINLSINVVELLFIILCMNCLFIIFTLDGINAMSIKKAIAIIMLIQENYDIIPIAKSENNIAGNGKEDNRDKLSKEDIEELIKEYME